MVRFVLHAGGNCGAGLDGHADADDGDFAVRLTDPRIFADDRVFSDDRADDPRAGLDVILMVRGKGEESGSILATKSPISTRN